MPNIYMGSNSNTQIPVRGKINEDIEILRNTYATAFDSINQWLLSPNNKLEKRVPEKIRGRFLVLHRLAAKYAPNKKSFIFAMEKLALANAAEKLSDKSYLESIRNLSIREGLDVRMINLIESKIRREEIMSVPKRKRGPKPTFGFQNLVQQGKVEPSFLTN